MLDTQPSEPVWSTHSRTKPWFSSSQFVQLFLSTCALFQKRKETICFSERKCESFRVFSVLQTKHFLKSVFFFCSMITGVTADHSVHLQKIFPWQQLLISTPECAQKPISQKPHVLKEEMEGCTRNLCGSPVVCFRAFGRDKPKKQLTPTMLERFHRRRKNILKGKLSESQQSCLDLKCFFPVNRFFLSSKIHACFVLCWVFSQTNGCRIWSGNNWPIWSNLAQEVQWHLKKPTMASGNIANQWEEFLENSAPKFTQTKRFSRTNAQFFTICTAEKSGSQEPEGSSQWCWVLKDCLRTYVKLDWTRPWRNVCRSFTEIRKQSIVTFSRRWNVNNTAKTDKGVETQKLFSPCLEMSFLCFTRGAFTFTNTSHSVSFSPNGVTSCCFLFHTVEDFRWF